MLAKLLQRIESLERTVEMQALVIADRDAEIVRLNAIILAQNEKIAKLEARLNTNSSNSSKPPSTDPPWKKKPKTESNGKRGGQKGHIGVARELVPEEEVSLIVPCLPPAFCECGGSIDVDPIAAERKQIFEIPKIEPHITEYKIFSGCCTICDAKFRGTLPAGTPSGMLGPNALATIGLFTGKYHFSKRDVVEFFHDYFGLKICAGTVCNAEQQVSEAIKAPYEELAAAIKNEPAVNADETSSKTAGHRTWMWIAATATLAVFYAMASRSKKVAQEILGMDFAGILISDRYSAYQWVCRRQLCWAHLIRDFRKLVDAGGLAKEFAEPVLTYVQEMFSVWHRFRDGEINRQQLQKETEPICEKIETYLKHGQTVPFAMALCKNLYKLKSALWIFIHNDGVEPTNNDAERTVRQYVIWRKTSFGTQGEKGNRFVERILTVVGTCKRQKRVLFDYLSSAVTAHLYGAPAPSLLPNTKN